MDLDRRCQSPEGQRVTLQAIITKLDLLASIEETDGVELLKKIQKDIFEAAPTCLPPILTSTLRHPQIGVREVRQSIMEACGIGHVRSTIVRR